MNERIADLINAEVQIETVDGEIYVILLCGTCGTVTRSADEYPMVWGYDLMSGKHITMSVKDICEI